MIFRRTPWWSGMAACIAALSVAITLMIFNVWPENPMARNILSEAVVASLVFAISARWYNPGDPRHAELKRFDEDLRTPVPSAPLATRSGLAVYGLIGTISLVLGGVLLLCTLLPGSPVAPASHNAVAGGLLILIGLGLRRVAGRSISSTSHE
jgi:SSS family solute:Na+ symporter